MAYRLIGSFSRPFPSSPAVQALFSRLRPCLEGFSTLEILGLAGDSLPVGSVPDPETLREECGFAAVLLEGAGPGGKGLSILPANLMGEGGEGPEGLFLGLLKLLEDSLPLPEPLGPAAGSHIAGEPLVLIGPMASGKTSIGAILAGLMGLPFLDTDAMVEVASGCPVAEVFRREGEAAFRRRESEALLTALSAGPAVMATGGGMVLSPANRAALRSRAQVVWLHARPEVLVSRLAGEAPGSRPLVDVPDPLARLSVLHAERLPLYASTASFLLPVEGRSAQGLAEVIHDALFQAG
jgi:shikimate kinase